LTTIKKETKSGREGKTTENYGQACQNGASRGDSYVRRKCQGGGGTNQRRGGITQREAIALGIDKRKRGTGEETSVTKGAEPVQERHEDSETPKNHTRKRKNTGNPKNIETAHNSEALSQKKKTGPSASVSTSTDRRQSN